MESKSAPVPDVHKPAAAGPVLDVVAPPPKDKNDQSGEIEIDPLDKLVAEDKAEQQIAAKKPKPKPVTNLPTKPKPTGNGVSLAITATVVIVLGLAVLATYAYLQTVK